MTNILLTCDDGINSPDLYAAKKAAEKFGRVYIYSPINQCTGVGCKVTLNKEISIKEFNIDGIKAFGVNGTPVDAMRLPLLGHMKIIPDLVISGINIGEQIGALPILMSGTCAAAFYAAAHKIPALAVGYKPKSEANKYQSYDSKSQILNLIPYPSEQLEKIIEFVFQNGLLGASFWNVNFPPNPTNKIEIVKMIDYGYYVEKIEIKKDKFINIGGVKRQGHEKGADAFFIEDKIVITPCRINFTDFEAITQIKEKFDQL